METGRPLATLIIVPLVLCLLRRGPRGGRVDTGDAVYILAGARGFPGGARQRPRRSWPVSGVAAEARRRRKSAGCRRPPARRKVRRRGDHFTQGNRHDESSYRAGHRRHPWHRPGPGQALGGLRLECSGHRPPCQRRLSWTSAVLRPGRSCANRRDAARIALGKRRGCIGQQRRDRLAAKPGEPRPGRSATGLRPQRAGRRAACPGLPAGAQAFAGGPHRQPVQPGDPRRPRTHRLRRGEERAGRGDSHLGAGAGAAGHHGQRGGARADRDRSCSARPARSAARRNGGFSRPSPCSGSGGRTKWPR